MTYNFLPQNWYRDTTIKADVFINGEPRILKVPAYSLDNLEPRRCSAYVRMAGKELFDKNFAEPPADAWNRKYLDKLIREAPEGTHLNLQKLVDDGILNPGMAVLWHYPKSTFNGELDMKGKIIKASHINLYLGQTHRDEPLFAEQFVCDTRVITDKKLIKEGLKPLEVIDAK